MYFKSTFFVVQPEKKPRIYLLRFTSTCASVRIHWSQHRDRNWFKTIERAQNKKQINFQPTAASKLPAKKRTRHAKAKEKKSWNKIFGFNRWIDKTGKIFIWVAFVAACRTFTIVRLYIHRRVCKFLLRARLQKIMLSLDRFFKINN